MLDAQFPWEQLENLVGQKLKTLAEASPFEIDRLEVDDVVLTISTGEERWITRAAFRRAWARLAAGDEVSREDLDKIEDRQGTYMAAILARIPGVGFGDDPVRVYPKLPTRRESIERGYPDVSEYLAWAAHNCPYQDPKKQSVWTGGLSSCESVAGWKEFDELLVGLIDEQSDPALRRVLRRLRREAREFLWRRT